MTIIIHYQGIGASTLAKKHPKFIDLESSNFFIGDKRDELWYIPYTNIAKSLHQQGYNVFVSSHDVVRQQLRGEDKVVIVCPDLSLKNEWISRLNQRYENTELKKDYNAYINAKVRFAENITDLLTEPFTKIIIKSMDYNLEELLRKI